LGGNRRVYNRRFDALKAIAVRAEKSDLVANTEEERLTIEDYEKLKQEVG